MEKTLILLLCALVGLAGCTTPDEASDDAEDGLGGGGGATPEFIVVDGSTYECDDTVNADGICDGYELNEGAAGDGTAQSVTANADGTLTIGGSTYSCDDTDAIDVDVTNTTDTTGACERYDRDE